MNLSVQALRLEREHGILALSETQLTVYALQIYFFDDDDDHCCNVLESQYAYPSTEIYISRSLSVRFTHCHFQITILEMHRQYFITLLY